MAKRLTDTDKWKKGWIKALPIEHKLVWVYLTDECNHAGIWHVEMDILNMRLRTQLTSEDILQVFSDKIIPIDNGNKWFIPNFIDFQYGELNPENKVHLSVINHLEKYKIKGLASPLQGAKDKDKDKNTHKDKEKRKEKQRFLDFVFLTSDECQKLEAGYGAKTVKKYLERLNDYIGSKGKKYKSHYHTLLTWIRRDEDAGKVHRVRKADMDCPRCSGTGWITTPGGGRSPCWCGK